MVYKNKTSQSRIGNTHCLGQWGLSSILSDLIKDNNVN